MPQAAPLTAFHEGAAIPFTLSRKRRKTLGIRVTREGTVEVGAPLRLSQAEIVRLVGQRGAWIVRHQRQAAQLPLPISRQYTSGEMWPFLGREYRLQVATGRVEGVEVVGDELRLTAREPGRSQQVLDGWLRVQAGHILAERARLCVAHAAAFGLHHSGQFTLRAMRSRWGSMSSAGRMTLNLYLIHAPTECIDFVILHELCHLQEFNHSPAYYALLSKVLPDWQARRELLHRAVALPKGEPKPLRLVTAMRLADAPPLTQPLAWGQ